MTSTDATPCTLSTAKPDWLTTPIEFEDQRGFRLSRGIMRIALAVVAGLLLWAAMAPIRELSLARGQMIPPSQVRPIQHLEGGTVDQILVRQGQVVEKDQPLVRLDPTTAEADLAALRVRAQNLALLRERVDALLSARKFDFSGLPTSNAALTAEHQSVYERRLAHRAKERQLLEARMEQRKAELASLSNEIVLQDKLVSIHTQQLEMRRILVVDGNISKRQLLDAESVLEQVRIQSQVTRGKLAATEQALLEAGAALAESEAQAHRIWSEELAKASSELAEVQESIRKHEDRVHRLVVRSPVHGLVHQMLQRSEGEVVRPGEIIARIVPLNEPLVAEVLVRPEDVAAVKVGDRAELKVTAYDFSRYGKIVGEVTAVSPTTFENDDKRSYYKVMIGLHPDHPTKLSAQLRPGMVVDAEIISGSRSLLQYLVKPLYRGIDIAFTER